ncbi:hypothetical protein X011_25595 [Mycobacterium tuberculosis variant microti OV254]|nr:hypothetical protein X011_25595 [Mycobacterium tuberculosis variant microti OV254]
MTMVPTLSQLQAWDTDHLANAASYWTNTADRWEDAFTQVRNQSNMGWEGQGGEALRTRAGRDLATVSTKGDLLRNAAKVARTGASEISAAQRRALYAVEDAENAGFVVGEDLSVTDTHCYADPAQQATRQAQADTFATDIHGKAAQLLAVETQISGQLTSAAGDVGAMDFAGPGSPANGNGVQLVDYTENSPAPPGLPQPLKDFINFQLQGKPLPPMTGPPITEIENRIAVIQQSQEWQQWLAAHPAAKTCGTGDIMKALGSMAAGDLSLLAGAAGAPETFTASFWLGLMAWATGQAVGVGTLATCGS